MKVIKVLEKSWKLAGKQHGWQVSIPLTTTCSDYKQDVLMLADEFTN